MKRVIMSLLFVVMAFSAFAQIVNVNAPSVSRVYDKVECEIEIKGEWVNPYLQEEVALDMLVNTPSGKKLVVPCYYESGESGGITVWKSRFLPQEKGSYTYSFQYSRSSVVVEESSSYALKVRNGKKHGIIHANDNWTFMCDDGTLYRGIAENICWESRTNDDSKYFKQLNEQFDRFSFDTMLPKFAENGGNFVRVWMCSWNFPIDRQSDFNNRRYTDSDGYMNISAIQHLDSVVEIAERLNLKFMLCMGAGNVEANHEFFVSDTARKRYKNRLRYIVARWGYSESIGAWELFNEIDNIQYRDPSNPIPASDIVAWHAEMAKYLKSIDAFGHLVTTSISHRDLDGLNSIDDIDFNQKHIYNASSSIPSSILRYEKEYGKPYVIGEFGREWDWSRNFDDYGDEMDADFRRGLWYGLFMPTPITPMSWWWEYFDDRGMVPYFKAVRNVSEMMLKQSGGNFQIVEAEAEVAEAYAVKCGDRTYVYVYNPSDTTTSSVVVTVSKPVCKVMKYDFTDLKFMTDSKVESEGGKVTIKCGVPRLSEALYVIR